MVAAARATGERDGGTAETDESDAETPTQEAPGGRITHWNRLDDPKHHPVSLNRLNRLWQIDRPGRMAWAAVRSFPYFSNQPEINIAI